MKMLCAEQTANQQPAPYALGADFCRIFEEDMIRLYLLSFLLTADPATAEDCFVSGLEDSQETNTVFKEWAQSWARRMIVLNAIRMIQPKPGDGKPGRNLGEPMTGLAMTGLAMIAAIANLSAFERFVFVMSVLECHTDQECSLLLETTRGEVVAARTRALRQITSSTELTPQPVSMPHLPYGGCSSWQTA